MKFRDRLVLDLLINVRNQDLKIPLTIMGLWAAYELIKVRNSLGPLNQRLLGQLLSDNSLPSYWIYSFMGILYLVIWVIFPTMIHMIDPMLYVDTDNTLTFRQPLTFNRQKIGLDEIQGLVLTFEFVPLPKSIIAVMRNLRNKDRFGRMRFKIAIASRAKIAEIQNPPKIQGEIANISTKDLEKFVNRLIRNGFEVTTEESTEGTMYSLTRILRHE